MFVWCMHASMHGRFQFVNNGYNNNMNIFCLCAGAGKKILWNIVAYMKMQWIEREREREQRMCLSTVGYIESHY